MSKSRYVAGLRAVEQLLTSRAADVRTLYAEYQTANPRVEAVIARAGSLDIEVKPANRGRLQQLSGDARHQGVVAEIRRSTVLDEAGLRTLVEGRLTEGDAAPLLLLVLEGIQDPHNLGACLRTADATGALAVVIPRDRAVQMNATVRKVAAGAAETTPLAVVTNLARALRLLKDAGLWIVGADAEAPKLAHETDLAGPIALVMGAEGSGLRQLTRETCDFLVRLPQQGSVESLNVSVATGMLLYEALRQRIVRK